MRKPLFLRKAAGLPASQREGGANALNLSRRGRIGGRAGGRVRRADVASRLARKSLKGSPCLRDEEQKRGRLNN